MQHVMFDIDGTLVKSYEFDEECFIAAIYQVLGHDIDSNWSNYKHVTDSGILTEHLKKVGIINGHEEIHQKVKKCFIEKVTAHLAKNPVSETHGASTLIKKLKHLNAVSLSIATGGWLETAILKLESAGIDYTDIAITSSNDHFSRTQIMKLAKEKAKLKPCSAITYFGDAIWDQQASKELGFNFVLVGNKIQHTQSVIDLQDTKQIFSFIGI